MKRIDLFGVIDIIAVKDDFPVLGVQSTSWGQRTPHITKIRGSEGSFNWLKADGTGLWLVTWKKERIKRGGTAFRYTPHVDGFHLISGELKILENFVSEPESQT